MAKEEKKLDSLFNPASVAIVGATEEERKVGNVITKNILHSEYKGKVFLVNPKYPTLFNEPCYPDLKTVKEKIDLAIIVIPAKFVNEVICGAADSVKNFVVIASGFSETGKEGHSREVELISIARQKKINILGPNCLGFLSPSNQLNASFASDLPAPGKIALISQSGALISAILDIAKTQGLGFSLLISTGNEAQLDEEDFTQYLAADEQTKVIGLYLEGIKDAKKFGAISSKVSTKKPIIVLKAGKTEQTQKAIASHTGSLAGSDEIIEVFFQKNGIIRADNLEEFLNLMKLASSAEIPQNDSVAIITNAGGPGVLATDAFSKKGIKLAPIDESAKEKLRAFLPPESSLENPIDLLGDAKGDRYEKVMDILEKEKAGSIVLILTPQGQTPILEIAQKIIDFRQKSKKTVITAFIGGSKIETAVKKLWENRVPNFSSPESAIAALNKYYQWSQFAAQKSAPIPEKAKGSEERTSAIKKIIQAAKKEHRKALFFEEAKELMDKYKINTIEAVTFFPVSLKTKFKLGYSSIVNWFNDKRREEKINNLSFPVTLKVDSDEVIHKTDEKALMLDIQNEDELQHEYRLMKSRFPGKRIIVEPMLPKNIELIVGMKRDEVFGPVIAFGLGGIYTEIFKKVDFLIPPMDLPSIKNALRKSSIGFLFQETRGQKSYNLDELSEIIHQLMLLSAEIKEINELDINPLLVYNDNQEATAVDVKVII